MTFDIPQRSAKVCALSKVGRQLLQASCCRPSAAWVVPGSLSMNPWATRNGDLWHSRNVEGDNGLAVQMVLHNERKKDYITDKA